MPIELWKIFPNVGKPQGNSYFGTMKKQVIFIPDLV